MSSFASLPILSNGPVIQIGGQMLTLSSLQPSSITNLSVQPLMDIPVSSTSVKSSRELQPSHIVSSSCMSFSTSLHQGGIDVGDELQLPPGSLVTLDTGQVIQIPGLDVIPLSVELDHLEESQNIHLGQGDSVELYLNSDDDEESSGLQHYHSPVHGKPGRPRKLRSNAEKPTGPGPFSCELCSQQLDKWISYVKHKKSHKLDRRLRCQECGTTFNVEKNLLLHIAGHQTGETLECPDCGRIFNRIASLRSHLAVHEEDDNLVCASCGEEFPTDHSLQKHMKLKHARAFVLSSSSLHRLHLHTVDASTSWICKLCNLDLESSKLFREHQIQHKKLKSSLELRKKVNRHISRDQFNYKCNFCGKKFSKPSQVRRHERVHTGEKPFKCKVCDKTFNQRTSLETHHLKHSGKKPFLCSFCPLRFTQRGNLHAHIKRLHNLVDRSQELFKCTICTCLFKKVGSLHTHISKFHPEEKLNRKAADENPSTTEEFLVNGTSLNPVEWTALEFDGSAEELFQGEKELDPARAHEDKDNQATKDLLSRALESAMNQPESRDVSAEGFRNYLVLGDKYSDGKTRKHLVKTKVHESGCVMYYCNWCIRAFKKPSDLIRHIRVHTKEKPFHCPHCSRAFSIKSSLSSHLRLHQNQKLTCDICDKVFYTASAMKVHNIIEHRLEQQRKELRTNFSKEYLARDSRKQKSVRVELPEEQPSMMEPLLVTSQGIVQNISRLSNVYNPSVAELNQRQFHCSNCSASFKKSSHLKQHIRSHTGEKPYVCFKCNKQFISRGSLNMHIKTHDRLKMYQCGVCSSTFTTPSSVRRHMATHQSEKPFLCPFCSKSFKTKVNCKKHIKLHRRAEASRKMEALSAETGQSSPIPPGLPEEVPAPSDGGVDRLLAPDLERAGSFRSSSRKDCDPYQDRLDEVEAFSFQLGFTNINLQGENGKVNSSEPFQDTGTDSQLMQMKNNEFLKLKVVDYQSDIKTIRIPLNSNILEQVVLSSKDGRSTELTSSIEASNVSDGVDLRDVPDSVILSSLHSEGREHSHGQTQPLPGSMNMFHEYLQPSSLPALNLSEVDKYTRDSSSFSIDVDSDQNTKPVDLERNIEIWKCGDCGLELDDLEEMNKHLAIHGTVAHKESMSSVPDRLSRYKCTQCTDVFANPAELASHMKSHSTLTHIYRCEICNGNFSTKSSYVRHQNVHSNKPHQCGHLNCSMKFKTLNGLTKHNIDEHGGDPGHLIDSELRRRIASQIKLSEEETRVLAATPKEMARTISERVLLDCVSEKLNNSEGGESGYKIVHTNKCDECEKSFKKPSDLTRHIRTHTGEKPYKCTKCEKSFAVKSTLRNHMKIHVGGKSLSCHVCSSLFAGKHSLKVHMRLHTGSLPYKCRFCDERFRTPSSRKAHTEVHIRSGEENPSAELVPLTISAESLSAALEAVSRSGAELLGETVQLQLHGDGFQSAVTQLHINADVLSQLRRGENININISNKQINQKTVPRDATKEELNNLPKIASTESIVQSSESAKPLRLLGPGLDPVEFVLGPENPLVDTGLKESDDRPISLKPGIELENYSLNLSKFLDPDHRLHTTSSGVAAQLMVTDLSDQLIGEEGDFDRQEEHSILNIHSEEMEPGDVQKRSESVPKISGKELQTVPSQSLNILESMDLTQVYICPYWCDRMFSTEQDRISHLLTDHGVEVTEDLENKAKERPEMRLLEYPKDVEMQEIQPPSQESPRDFKSYTCSVCLKPFQKPSQLNRHMRVHTGERPFQCDICNKSFNQKNALQIHIKKHNGERPYVCEFCFYPFTQKGNLKMHIMRNHAGEQEKEGNVAKDMRKWNSK